MDPRDMSDFKPIESLRDMNPLITGTMTPPQPMDDSPSLANRRRARPFSLLSYNPVVPQHSSSPSPLPSESHSRHASFSSTTRPYLLPATATPSKRPSRWTVIIIPPALLPHSPPPPHVSGFAQGYGPSGRYSTGLILPLQPTLTLQLTSIAREFSLPSTGGLTLHLSISSSDQPSIPGPRVTDESWSVLFGWTFEDTPSPYAGLQPSIGLPIAGRLEFDIDLKKARWFEAWAASSQTTNRLASQVQYSLKLPSAHSTPAGNRALDLAVGTSSLPPAGATSLIALPRRHSSQSSVTYDTSREVSKQLPVTISEQLEDDLEPPTPNKSPSSPENQMPPLSSTPRSTETFRQQLERLVESEDSALADENSWHIKQANMLRQAAIEREQIELADRLEEERRIEEEAQNLRNVHSSTQPQVNITKKEEQPSSIQRHETSHPKQKDINEIESRTPSEPVDETLISQVSVRSVDEATGDLGSIETQDKAIESVIVSQENKIAIDSAQASKLTIITEAVKDEQVETRSSGLVQSESMRNETVTPFPSSDSQPSNQDNLTQPDIKSGSAEEANIKYKSAPTLQRKMLDSGLSPSFSTTLGRSVNRFSGEQELLKRRNKTEQGDEETQKLIDEMNRLVNEKAMAKEASILSNSKKIVAHDSESPIKATLKAPPPPPPTRSKVVQLARAFSPSEERPAQRSPTIDGQSRDNSPAIPTVSTLPSASDPDLRHLSPVIQGTSSTSPTIPLVPLPPSTSEPEPDFRPLSPIIQGASFTSPAMTSAPLPPSTSEARAEAPRRLSGIKQDSFSSAAPKSTTSSVASSPSTRTLSLFKPHLSSSSNFLSNIFRSHSTSSSIDLKAITADPLAPLLHSYGNTDTLSEQLANYIISSQNQALQRHKKFVVAISGGSLPKLLASGLLENPDVKWDTWKVFFTDEKIVPLDHLDSNFANSMEALFNKVPIDRSQLVGILGLPSDDIDLDEMGPLVSSIYMAQVLEELEPSLNGSALPRFDLILLDVEEDGHTCSLFPSHRILDDTAIVGWCNDSPKPPTHRITMTLPVLNAAHNLAFVCIGSSKDETLRSILELEPSPTRPASLIKLPHQPVVWFVDEAAAAKTQYPHTTQELIPSDQVQSVSKDLVPDHESDGHRSLNGLQLEGIRSYSITKVASMDKSSQITAEVACKNEEEPNGLLFSGTRKDLDVSWNQFGYPYNLQIYPAVYPHVDQLLYRPPFPQIPAELFLAEKFISRQSTITVSDQYVISTKVEQDTIEIVKESDRRTTDSTYSESTQFSIDSIQKPERGYPFNLRIYPFVYPHLEDKLYGPVACNGPISPPLANIGLLPPMVSLIPNDVEDLNITKSNDIHVDGSVVRQEVELTLDQDQVDDLTGNNSIGYPYSLIVYPAVYPHVADTLYLELGPLCPATQQTQIVRPFKKIPAPLPPFSSQVTESRGIAIGGSPELESHLTERSINRLEANKSPVAIAPSTLTEAFHSPLESLKVTSATRVFSPSVPYTQREINNELVDAVSPLALQASPSILDQSYYDSSIPQSRANRPKSNLELALSPVQIIPSQLAESFYRDDSDSPSKILRVISPSVPFTHPLTAQNEATRTIPAAALKASPSALSDGFFANASTRDPSTEVAHVQFDKKMSAEDISKNQQENDRQDGADRQSEGSYSHFSKGDSINSHVTLHQSTDDDWPPTPHSSDGVPSPNAVGGLSMSPPLVREVNGSSAIKCQFSGPESPTLVADQTLIESNQRVSISSLSQARMLSPAVTRSHDGSMIAGANGSDSQSNGYLTTQSTPRASIVQSSKTSVMSSLAESDQQVSTSIVQSHSESVIHSALGLDSPQGPSELQAESTPRARVQPELESLEPDSPNCYARASQDQELNGLGIDLGQPAAEETQNDSSSEAKADRQLSNLETTGLVVEDKLIHSSDRFECQITPLDKIAEVTWTNNSGDPSSPPRLPSPSLIDRILLTPGTPSSIDKQFPTYGAHLTGEDEEAFITPPKIEVAWDCPQIPLSEVGFASPPRPASIPLNPSPHTEREMEKEPSSPVNSNSDNQDTQSLILDDETTRTVVVSDGAGPGSPFFIDQGPMVSGLNDAVEHLSSPASPIHAISIDRVVPDRSPGRVSIERSFPVSYDRMNSPLLPPLNLAMDLSDPLSAASTAHIDGFNSPMSTTEEGPELSAEPSMFGDQSNGFNIDQVLEQSEPRTSGHNPEELVTELTTSISESLPSITKRAPTPASDEVGIALEPVSIEDSSPSPPPILLPFEDLAELSEALAQFIFEAQEVAFQRHGKFQLALGGSVLPQILGAGLVGDDRMRWDKWEIFLVEEAIAPLESPESVLSAITESIIQHVPIPRAQVHSIAELTKADLIETAAIPEGLDSLADSLADEYENKLLELFPEASHETAQPPEFDLILISVGEEGQVGSLYPSHPMLGESNWFVAWLGDAWKPPSHRITLTLPVLNAARQFAFLAIGQELAEIVADGLDRSIQSDVPLDEDRVNPTALVKSSNLKPVVWFTDFAAAALTDYPKSTFWDEP